MSWSIHRFSRGSRICLSALCAGGAIQTSAADSALPSPVTAESFTHLTNHSPFVRSIDYSDSLVLTGVARIEGNVYATLFDSESTESHIVSERSNSAGWQLVDVQGDEADLESLTAKIQVNGGEVFAIRYQKIEFNSASGGTPGSSGSNRSAPLSQEQIDDAKRAARNPREGFRGDGYRGAPPPEILEKLQRISPQQREQLARRVMQMRNNGVESEVRTRFYNDALNRAVREDQR
ncbi:MAG: hypothetical protein AAGA96_08995 [Verrucomicrobiota bacterium]